MQDEHRIYRRNEHRLFFTVAYLLLVGVAVVLAVAASPIIALAAVPLLFLTWRTFRVGVVVGSDGVTVRNVCRDRRIAWDDVDRFDWGHWWGFPIGGVWLRGGGFVRAWALNPPMEFRQGESRAVPRALAGLNAELSTRRGSADAAEPDPPATQLTLGDS